MSLAARRRRGLDFWPGFVDALSALLMVLVFLLLVFTVGQFVLSDALSGRDKALAQLNRELAELARSLSMEQSARAQALLELGELRATLAESDARGTQLAQTLEARDAELARIGADLAALQALKAELEAEIAARLADLDSTRGELVEKTELSERALAQAELLNRQLAALRTQLDEITAALALAKAQSAAKDARIDELGRELNLALANRVNQLERYRSEFFGRLREILGNRDDLVVVGDRFVVPSELLFPSGSDALTAEGQRQLDRVALTLREVTAEIPSDLDWVLRIDGHTDRVPISTARFPSNWELSSARAIAIVKHLVVQGIPAHRLSANGFGEFRPLDAGGSPEALARNRRIEIQLTNR